MNENSTGRGFPAGGFAPTRLSFRLSRGYTLLEMIVVLILLTIATMVTLPSFLGPRRDESSSIRNVVERGRAAAVRRGELVRLHIGASGEWQITAGSAPNGEVLAAGRLSGTSGSADLLFSPLGTCGTPPEDPVPPALASFEPLTCEPRSS
jgi:prepilin-type N-terminal cleavage/methylation domain-containing protein